MGGQPSIAGLSARQIAGGSRNRSIAMQKKAPPKRGSFNHDRSITEDLRDQARGGRDQQVTAVIRAHPAVAVRRRREVVGGVVLDVVTALHVHRRDALATLELVLSQMQAVVVMGAMALRVAIAVPVMRAIAIAIVVAVVRPAVATVVARLIG